jgi:hypothetical protein
MYSLCQPRPVTNHKDVIIEDNHNDGINEERKYPKADDNNRMSSSATRKKSK